MLDKDKSLELGDRDIKTKVVLYYIYTDNSAVP